MSSSPAESRQDDGKAAETSATVEQESTVTQQTDSMDQELEKVSRKCLLFAPFLCFDIPLVAHHLEYHSKREYYQFPCQQRPLSSLKSCRIE